MTHPCAPTANKAKETDDVDIAYPYVPQGRIWPVYPRLVVKGRPKEANGRKNI